MKTAKPNCVASLTIAATWLLTAGASANLLVNPGFELPALVPPENQAAGAEGWTTFNTAGVRTAQQRSGEQSLRLAPNGPTGTGDGIARQEFAAAANDVVSFGARVLNPSSDPLTGDRTAQLRIQWLNAGDTLINQSILNIADVDTPQDIWINFRFVDLVLPDNENIVKVRPSLFVTNDGGTGGGAAFFDDAEFLSSNTGLALASVPEPAAASLVSVASLGLTFLRRRSR